MHGTEESLQMKESLPSFSKFISTLDDSGYYVKTPPNLNAVEDNANSFRQRIAAHRSIDDYSDSSMSAMEYLKSSEHARNALSSPDSFLNHFQNKYSFEKGGLAVAPLKTNPQRNSVRNNQSVTNMDDHSTGIRTESKLIPANIPAHNIFGESSILEQSLYSESVLDYNFTMSTEFSGSVNKPVAPVNSNSNSNYVGYPGYGNVLSSAEKLKQKTNMFDSNIKPTTPSGSKASGMGSKPTTPSLTKVSGGSKPTTPGGARPLGTYQSPNIILTSAGIYNFK